MMVRRDDLKYLNDLREEHRLMGAGDILHKLLLIVKKNKLAEVLK